jgi:hypothetical protein
MGKKVLTEISTSDPWRTADLSNRLPDFMTKSNKFPAQPNEFGIFSKQFPTPAKLLPTYPSHMSYSKELLMCQPLTFSRPR